MTISRHTCLYVRKGLDPFSGPPQHQDTQRNSFSSDIIYPYYQFHLQTHLSWLNCSVIFKPRVNSSRGSGALSNNDYYFISSIMIRFWSMT